MIFNLEEIIIVTILSIFQSIFGVGLLLFGTPIFLILGNDFFDSLNILIPVSIMISFLQIKSNQFSYKNDFIKRFNIITIPSLLFALYFVVTNYQNININLIISSIIIIFSLVNIFLSQKILKKNNDKIIDSFIFLLIGLVHGLTNLGGSLLTLASTKINDKKEIVRFCIAYGYLTMGIFQLFVINFFTNVEFNLDKIYLIIIPFVIFKFSQIFFKHLSNLRYNLILNLIALFFGIYIFFQFLSSQS